MMVKATAHEPIFGHRVYAIIFLVIVGYILYSIIAMWNKTPEQIEAEEKANALQNAGRQDAHRRNAEAQRNRRAADAYMCRVKAACEKYAVARQDCAIAGDFNNCVAVKLGAEAAMIKQCMSDGDRVSSIYSDQTPNLIECYFHSLAHYLGGEPEG